MNTNKNHIEDYLLISYLAGNISTEEKTIVENWIASCNENLKHYQKVKNIWQESGDIEDFDLIDLEANWESISQKVGIQSKKKSELPFYLKPVWKVAAIILLVATSTLVIYKNQTDSNLITISANTEAQNKFVLPDGSKVWLNEGSKISYKTRFSGSERRLDLAGEGFFEIVENREKPFIISTNNTETKVLGTSFNLKGAENTELVLVTGKVLFSKGTQQSNVLPGEKVFVSEEGNLVKETNTDLNFLSWKTQSLVFQKTPMSQVIKDINALYKVEIVIESEGFELCPLTTQFENESLENVLETISVLFEVEISPNGSNKYTLRGNGC